MNGFYDIISWPFGQVLYLFYDLLNNNYAIALITFTIVAKFVLLPMAISQQKSQAKSMRSRSKLEKLRKKYGDDQQKLNEELQAFYKKEGYGSMTGGCGLLLVQFPIIIGLYGAIYKPLSYILRIPNDIVEKLTTDVTTLQTSSTSMGRQGEILVLSHIDDLQKMNPTISSDIFDKMRDFDFTAFGLDMAISPQQAYAAGNKYYIFVALASFLTAFLSALYSYLRQKKLNVGGDQSANASLGCMTIFMPLMSLWLAYQFPVGIGIYWALNSLLSFVQTLALNKIYSPGKVIAKIMVEETVQRRNREEAVKVNTELMNRNEL